MIFYGELVILECDSRHSMSCYFFRYPNLIRHQTSKAGATEVQKRNTGRKGSSYTSNESSCRVEYESTTFFEVNTCLKYFSVDKPLCIFLFSLVLQ